VLLAGEICKLVCDAIEPRLRSIIWKLKFSLENQELRKKKRPLFGSS